MSAAQYRASLKAARRANKFGAIPAYRCGLCGTEHVIRFDSKAEARRWDTLLQTQKLGLISQLRRQVPFDITMQGQGITKYVADFVYMKDGETVVEDVKSPASRTPVYLLKKKMMLAEHGIEIKEVR